MNKKITKALTVGAISAGLVFGGAASAQAASYYVPGSDIAVTATKTADRTYVVTVKSGTFGINRTVKIKIPKRFFARFGDVTSASDAEFTTVSNAEGGIDPFTVELPEEISGTFTLTAESEDATSVSSTFSVDAAGAPTVLAAADKGIDGTLVGLWVGGAAVVLAGGALVANGRRNQRAGN